MVQVGSQHMATTSSPPPAASPVGVSPGATRPAVRPRLLRHPWRAAVIVIVLVAVANLGTVLFHEADTSRTGQIYPNAIDSVSPAPGEIISPNATITVDLRDDLTGVLLLAPGGSQLQEVPEDQTDRVIPLGQLSFRPGPGKEISQFAPGDYSAVVYFWTQGKDRPAKPGAYQWSFRVGA